LLEADTRFGYLHRGVASHRAFNPKLILNDDSGTMLRALRDELRHSDSFVFSVAFVTPRAIALLKQELLDHDGPGTVVTSTYLGFNSPRAFDELLSLRNLNIDVRLHSARAFHPKGYIFGYPDRVTAILGSSNLTEQALAQNHEWNLRVSAARTSDLADQLSELVDEQRRNSVPLDQSWIDAYAESYRPPERRQRSGGGPNTSPGAPIDEPQDRRPAIDEPGELASTDGALSQDMHARVVPNPMQSEALVEISRVRASGVDKALVISATGTGKTILAALDVRDVAPARMLFIVHREQILDRAIFEFGRVLGEPPSAFGKLAGGTRDVEARYLFATIQTLSKPDVLQGIDPRAFEYVLVDEVHHAGASSYQRVLEHLEPDFLLGMTATPERTDGFNVFELFDFNVPYEIRLARALESDMLAPFHYYGVADVKFDDGTTVHVEDRIDRLASRVRVDHVLAALDRYAQAGVQPKGLIFCSRVEEAMALSEKLNASTFRGRELRTVALSGSDATLDRELAVEALTEGSLDYILTVDIFNEGVDIPAVNQVVMLRQTQSSIVFVQQLGRGLRKHGGKEYTVVIDFIGNYANNYLIPIALLGDDSLNKESVRQHLISIEERGVLPGLSSVRFDRISQERVLASLADVNLDSMRNIRAAFDLLRNRLGRVPDLRDFYRFESADPIVVATRVGNYPELVARFTKEPLAITEAESRALTFLSLEVFDAKRTAEATVVRTLLDRGEQSMEELGDHLEPSGLASRLDIAESAVRSLMLDFYTQQEQQRYRDPIAQVTNGRVSLTEALLNSYRSSKAFAHAVDDLVETGITLTSRRYEADSAFTVGRQYSRKDACRLLGWRSNSSSTIYGYKVDQRSGACPIFVTLHKSVDVSASTAYEDELLDRQNMRWFTRSRRTLASGEVAAIVSHQVAVHVFAKKSDAEGSDFYYLGRAVAHDAEDTTMTGNDGAQLNVVAMRLQFESPIDSAIFDYFHPVVTD